MRQWTAWLLASLALAGGAGYAQDRTAPASLMPRSANKIAAPAPAPAPPVTNAGPHDLTKSDLDTWLDGYMPYALRAADIPGAVVTVVKDGQILSSRGFGYADLAKRTPVDPDRTLFRPGSVSKLFVWTAVMQMVEQNKLHLDTDINPYLDFKIPPRDGKPVTLRQIMTHTGGFEEVGKGVVFYDPKLDLSMERYVKRWVPHRIFAPGTTPAYSNWATTLAAYMVQRASGEDFNAYVEHHIFAPLGMRYATFREPLPATLARYMATGYPKPGEAKGFEYVGPAPAGAASVSGTDMGRFMIAHLQDGALDGQRILRPETAVMMHEGPLDHVDPFSLMPPLNRMRLGFFDTGINGRTVIGHLGDTSAFHTSLHLFLREHVGFYVSFNSPGKDGAVQPLRTAVFEDFADRYFPDIAPPDGRVDVRTARQHAQMMTGRWMVSRRPDSSFLSAVYWLTGQTVISTGANGELVVPTVTNAGGRPRQWVEIAPFIWRDMYGHDLLAAKVVNGQVVRWTFNLAAPFEVFDRVPANRSAGWIVPALCASLVILLVSFLYWPATFLVRRHYKGTAPLSGPARRAHRASRLMAGLSVALAAIWAWAILTIAGDGGDFAAWDTPVIVIELLSIIVFVGAVPITGWNLWLTWTDGRHWTRKLWSLLLFLATLLMLYVAITFHLTTLQANY